MTKNDKMNELNRLEMCLFCLECADRYTVENARKEAELHQKINALKKEIAEMD